MSKKHRILYLSYEGMTDALGQSQVLSYMEVLAQKYNISIISFEKSRAFAECGDEVKQRCSKSNIDWHPLTYTKTPPILSKIYDVRRMRKRAEEIFKVQGFEIVHCRSYITSIVGVELKKKLNTKFIFDMRGFWIDERIEAGYWNPRSVIYSSVINYFRKKEKIFYKESDAIIVLTQAAKKVVESLHPDCAVKTTVIPTCVNLSIFKPFDIAKREEIRNKLEIAADTFVLLYSGGFGANYNIDFLLEVYRVIKKEKSNTIILILSKDGVSGLEDKKGIIDFITVSLPFSKVSGYLMAGDLGVINYFNNFSVAGRSPTKLGEYWASGLPAISPTGVGDLDYLFKKYEGGGIIYEQNIFINKLNDIEEISKEKLRQYAIDYFALEKGVTQYDNVYKMLLENG